MFVDYQPLPGCQNEDSMGEICVQCNRCNRFMSPLESNILTEVRLVSGDRKLRWKDLMEWSLAPFEKRDDETTYFLPINGVYVKITKKDKSK